ncbi:MAG: DNA starvation/stationary phase protection protein [Hydrotalea sp.]|jgi:starvation-inducible DNA-binding protein|nr:DNA starvation/stationary phase protection protein [Hydrotalea sp.]
MNTIGLDHEKSKVLAEHLNDLLANYMVFYQNVRGFHWNIKGEKFFELHLKFEELYNNVLLKVDELAERILTLESTPLHSFEDYVQISSIKSTKDISEGKEALKHILSAFQVIIVKQRNILSVASEAGDEGTNALMSDYIREQEKLVWMYRSYLG